METEPELLARKQLLQREIAEIDKQLARFPIKKLWTDEGGVIHTPPLWDSWGTDITKENYDL